MKYKKFYQMDSTEKKDKLRADYLKQNKSFKKQLSEIKGVQDETKNESDSFKDSYFGKEEDKYDSSESSQHTSLPSVK